MEQAHGKAFELQAFAPAAKNRDVTGSGDALDEPINIGICNLPHRAVQFGQNRFKKFL